MNEPIEGRIAVLAALEARIRRIDVLLVSEGTREERVSDVIMAAERTGVPVKRVSSTELDRMTHGKTHGGVVAIGSSRPATPLTDLLRTLDASTTPPFLVLLEGIDDARNLGFTLRTADALGAHGVLIKKHVWEFDGVTVSRASSGAYERMPLVRVEDAQATLLALRRFHVRAWGAIAGAKRTLYEADLAGPVLLAIGGEKRGLSGAMRDLCDGFLRIPMREEATSLPLSHAAAVLMAEVRRQRMRDRNVELPTSNPQARASGMPGD